MARERWRLPAIGGAASFGAAGGVLALMGVGVPFVVAAVGLAVCVGVVIDAARRPAPPDMAGALQTRIEALVSMNTALRHDLRGVLSPALMMSDRLTSHADPSIRRAGEAVVKSVDRATAILAASKDV